MFRLIQETLIERISRAIVLKNPDERSNAFPTPSNADVGPNGNASGVQSRSVMHADLAGYGTI